MAKTAKRAIDTGKSDESTCPNARAPLNNKQAAFVREYLIDLNATAAYKRAGYKDTAAAEHNASRLMGNDKVRKAIDRAIAERAKRTEIAADDVLKELALIAFSDIGQIMDFTGDDVRLKPANEIEEAVRRTLSTMKVKRYVEGHGEDARTVEIIEFKMLDKLQALVKYGQHLGMFKTKVELSGEGGGAIPIEIISMEIVDQDGDDDLPSNDGTG